MWLDSAGTVGLVVLAGSYLKTPSPYYSPAMRGEAETGKGLVDLFPVERAHSIRVRHGREQGGE